MAKKRDPFARLAAYGSGTEPSADASRGAALSAIFSGKPIPSEAPEVETQATTRPTEQIDPNDTMGRIAAAASAASEKYGVPEERILAHIETESNYDPKATGIQTSTGKAMGLMQLMPETAKDLGVEDAYNIEQNIFGGAKYLKKQFDRFGDWDAASQAYYSGGQGMSDLIHGRRGFRTKEEKNYLPKITKLVAKYESRKPLPVIPEPPGTVDGPATEVPKPYAGKPNPPELSAARLAGAAWEGLHADVPRSFTVGTGALLAGAAPAIQDDKVVELVENEEAFNAFMEQEQIKAQSTGEMVMTPTAYKNALKSRYKRIKYAREKGIKTPSETISKAGMDLIEYGLTAEWMAANPDYYQSSGWWEDLVRATPQFASQILLSAGATAVGGPTAGAAAGMAFMGPQIMGGTYENLIKRDVPHHIAIKEAFTTMILTAPLEQIGISKTAKLFGLRKAIQSRLIQMADSGLSEGVTEFLQTYPEAAAQLVAKNPDKSFMARFAQAVADPQTFNEAVKNGSIGAVLGLAGGAMVRKQGAQAEDDQTAKMRDIAEKEARASEKRGKAKVVTEEEATTEEQDTTQKRIAKSIARKQKKTKKAEQKAKKPAKKEKADETKAEPTEPESEFQKLAEKERPHPRAKDKQPKGVSDVVRPKKKAEKKPAKEDKKADKTETDKKPERIKNTEEALEIGKKAGKEGAKELREKEAELREEVDKLAKKKDKTDEEFNEQMDVSTQAQFYREAAEVAEEDAKSDKAKTPKEKIKAKAKKKKGKVVKKEDLKTAAETKELEDAKGVAKKQRGTAKEKLEGVRRWKALSKTKKKELAGRARAEGKRRVKAQLARRAAQKLEKKEQERALKVAQKVAKKFGDEALAGEAVEKMIVAQVSDKYKKMKAKDKNKFLTSIANKEISNAAKTEARRGIGSREVKPVVTSKAFDFETGKEEVKKGERDDAEERTTADIMDEVAELRAKLKDEKDAKRKLRINAAIKSLNKELADMTATSAETRKKQTKEDRLKHLIAKREAEKEQAKKVEEEADREREAKLKEKELPKKVTKEWKVEESKQYGWTATQYDSEGNIRDVMAGGEKKWTKEQAEQKTRNLNEGWQGKKDGSGGFKNKKGAQGAALRNGLKKGAVEIEHQADGWYFRRAKEETISEAVARKRKESDEKKAEVEAQKSAEEQMAAQRQKERLAGGHYTEGASTAQGFPSRTSGPERKPSKPSRKPKPGTAVRGKTLHRTEGVPGKVMSETEIDKKTQRAIDKAAMEAQIDAVYQKEQDEKEFENLSQIVKRIHKIKKGKRTKEQKKILARHAQLKSSLKDKRPSVLKILGNQSGYSPEINLAQRGGTVAVSKIASTIKKLNPLRPAFRAWTGLADRMLGAMGNKFTKEVQKSPKMTWLVRQFVNRFGQGQAYLNLRTEQELAEHRLTVAGEDIAREIREIDNKFDDIKQERVDKARQNTQVRLGRKMGQATKKLKELRGIDTKEMTPKQKLSHQAQIEKAKKEIEAIVKEIDRLAGRKPGMKVSKNTLEARMRQIASGGLTGFGDKFGALSQVAEKFNELEKELRKRGLLDQHQFLALSREQRDIAMNGRRYKNNIRSEKTGKILHHKGEIIKSHPDTKNSIRGIEKRISSTYEAMTEAELNERGADAERLSNQLNKLLAQRVRQLSRLQIHYKQSGRNYIRIMRDRKQRLSEDVIRFRNIKLSRQYALRRRNWQIKLDKDGVVHTRHKSMLKGQPLKDLEYSVRKGINEEARDMFLYDMFNRISSTADAKTILKSEKKLLQYAKDFGLTRKQAFDFLNSSQDWVLPEKTKSAKGYKRIPNDEDKYGPLAGRLVQAPIASEILQYTKVYEGAKRAYLKTISAWKKGKTIWNPATQVRNFGSNLILADILGDLDYTNPTHWKYYQKGFAAINRINAGKELNDIEKEIKWDTRIQRNTFVKAELDDMGTFFDLDGVKNENEVIERFLKAAQKARVAPGKLYALVEEGMKAAIYMKHRDAGKTSREAEAMAHRALFDYNDVPPVVRVARQGYSPFATFVYKAIPALAVETVRRPWKIAQYYAYFYLYDQLKNIMMGEDEEEMDQKERVLPEHMQRDVLPGMASHIRLPIEGNTPEESKWLDLSYILPWGELTEGQGDTNIWFRALQPNNPIWNTYYDMKANENIFLQKDLALKHDDGGEIFLKFMLHGIEQAAPGVLSPRKWNRIMTAFYGDVDWKGDKYSIGEAVADTLFGIKIRTQHWMRDSEFRSKEIDEEIADLRFDFGQKYKKIMWTKQDVWSEEKKEKEMEKLYRWFNDEYEDISQKQYKLMGMKVEKDNE